MTKITWDTVGDRLYEAGVSKGVLYLEDGSPVPWNGLISVSESFDDKSEAVYFDGVKVLDVTSPGEFAATITAFTYPDEFILYMGMVTNQYIQGLYFTEQATKNFSMSYQTLVGNDVDGLDFGYQIHILYNLTAKPGPLGYDTVSDKSAMEFTWDVNSIPEDVPGYQATAHAIFDSRYTNPGAMAHLEELLYGTDLVDGSLLPLSDLFTELSAYSVITILDNGDGTWTAIGPSDHISMTSATTFEIVNANALIIDADTYTISSS